MHRSAPQAGKRRKTADLIDISAELDGRRTTRQGSGAAELLADLASTVSRWTGSTMAFACALAVVLVWAAIGPLAHYSNTWQLVINTGTTIVTFLMVFLLQRAQNKDALAIQLKLDELVAAMKGASNRLINVESLSERDLETLHRFYVELATRAKRDEKLSESHSVEEAKTRHERKR